MKSLFIGLGGFGTKTLDCLCHKIDSFNNNLSKQNRLGIDAYYYYIDTDRALYNQSPERFLPGSGKCFHTIGNYAPNQIIKGLQRGETELYDLLKKWYDAPPKMTNMEMGADVIRQYARLAFSSEALSIRNQLILLIQQVIQQNGHINVITSCCGGTGSGIYMDLLYMISEIYEFLNIPSTLTDVRLIMAMPEGYISNGSPQDIANMKMRLNAFATLEELNAICKQINSLPSTFNGCYIGPHKKNGSFTPFRFGYFYDTIGQSPNESCLDLSDFLFELEIASDTNNCPAWFGGYKGSHFNTMLTNNVDANWHYSINDEYVKAFNAIGRYSIEKPDFLYKKYFSNRLLFDIFHRGLLGENKSVDKDFVRDLATRFMEGCDCQIHQACGKIQANYLTHNIFDGDYNAAEIFSVLTPYPNERFPVVKMVIKAKEKILSEIEEWAYSQCKEWLCRYDFSTVYAVLEQLDVATYAKALCINQDYAAMLDKAKEASRGGFLRRRIQPERAMEQFRQMLNVWLNYEVSKALSSGRDVDITVQNHGYLDNCKEFVEIIAKRNFSLETEQEHWDVNLKKEVCFLKQKNDRSYIPNLDTLVDDQCNFVPDSPMVVTYDRVMIDNPAQANFTQGTCTPATLHERIMDEMRNNEDDCHLDKLFDPTPGVCNNLCSSRQANQFVAKYVETAKKQIDLLLNANESYQQLFADDVLTRLQYLPQQERMKICLNYAHYDDVQMKTTNMLNDAVTTYTYHLISNASNIPLMHAFGILDATGQKSSNTDHSPTNFFFEDKIVKIIVKSGYRINDYRFFEVYKDFAERYIEVGRNYDPFIDKRFLGKPDKHGKYPCDVNATLEEIAEEKVG